MNILYDNDVRGHIYAHIFIYIYMYFDILHIIENSCTGDVKLGHGHYYLFITYTTEPTPNFFSYIMSIMFSECHCRHFIVRIVISLNEILIFLVN